jgi:hypothetical protein
MIAAHLAVLRGLRLTVGQKDQPPRALSKSLFLSSDQLILPSMPIKPVLTFGDMNEEAAAANELQLTASVLKYARHASAGRVSFTRVSGSILYRRMLRIQRKSCPRFPPPMMLPQCCRLSSRSIPATRRCRPSSHAK